ncbi:MAG: IS3 family transposase [Acidaminococcaceae bacterium]|nr:IS3 family transposase [Acidaminococcaceae bacterium]MBQ5345732.1 IS3 family transposase [Acidaminococcaceae bacterium]MBR1495841.1 IS3 family transposase [Acidaminococcaceae bacterium]
MGIKAPANVKFQLICEALRTRGNCLSVSLLCRIAGVSRSGFYAWTAAAPSRLEREEKDKADFDLVLSAYCFRGYAKGARGIHMRLLHQGIIMNVKKVRRLMHKFSLFCPIRKANPYRRMAKALRTNHVAPNIVERGFTTRGPRKVLLTDITYLFYATGHCFLSTILDAFTHEILAYQLSESLQVTFVIETVDQLVREHGCTLDNETIVHSDQGCHYTSWAFINKLKEEEFVQSMSRRGNCWDNAPQESFYGHMKDEIRDTIKKFQTYAEVKSQVDDWMDYYNKDRYQWELLKLSPCEYYQYLQTGVYPLPVYDPKKRQPCWGAAPDPGVYRIGFREAAEATGQKEKGST